MRVDERDDDCATGTACRPQLLARDGPPLLRRAQHEVSSKLSKALRVKHALLDFCVARTSSTSIESRANAERRSQRIAEHGTALYIQENHTNTARHGALHPGKPTVAVPGGGCEEVMLERPFREDALMGG